MDRFCEFCINYFYIYIFTSGMVSIWISLTYDKIEKPDFIKEDTSDVSFYCANNDFIGFSMYYPLIAKKVVIPKNYTNINQKFIVYHELGHIKQGLLNHYKILLDILMWNFPTTRYFYFVVVSLMKQYLEIDADLYAVDKLSKLELDSFTLFDGVNDVNFYLNTIWIWFLTGYPPDPLRKQIIESRKKEREIEENLTLQKKVIFDS